MEGASLKRAGLAAKVNFIYVPGCFKNKEYYGYAFVNCISHEARGANPKLQNLQKSQNMNYVFYTYYKIKKLKFSIV